MPGRAPSRQRRTRVPESVAAAGRPPVPAAPAAPAVEANKENTHAGVHLRALGQPRGGRLAAMKCAPGPAATPAPAPGAHQRAHASPAARRAAEHAPQPHAAAVPSDHAVGAEAGPASGLEPGQAEGLGRGHAAAETDPGGETAAVFVAQLVAATRAGGSFGSADAVVAADRKHRNDPAWAVGSSRGACAAEQRNMALQERQAKRKGCVAQLPVPGEAPRPNPAPGPAGDPEGTPCGQLGTGLAAGNDPPAEAAGPAMREREGLQGLLSCSRTADATAAAPAHSGERHGHEAAQQAAAGAAGCVQALAPGSDAAREARRACTPPARASREVWESAARQCAPREPCMAEQTHAPAGDAANLLRDLGLDSPEATQAGSMGASADAADAAPGGRAAPEPDGAASPSAEELAAVLAHYNDAYVVQVLSRAACLAVTRALEAFSCTQLTSFFVRFCFPRFT